MEFGGVVNSLVSPIFPNTSSPYHGNHNLHQKEKKKKQHKKHRKKTEVDRITKQPAPFDKFLGKKRRQGVLG